MPISENNFEEIKRTDEYDQYETILCMKGRVTSHHALAAKYRIHASEIDHSEYWVLELKQDGKCKGTLLLEFRYDLMGFEVVDPLPEDFDLFSPYDFEKAISREHFFASDIANETFELLDIICLQDEEVRKHHDYRIRQLFCTNVGPFYVTDALQLAPRLQEDEIVCEFFLVQDDDWIPVTLAKLQQSEPKRICMIAIPRQQGEIAYDHFHKIFPKGTQFFQDGDSGEEGWIDESTMDVAKQFDELQNLRNQMADLERQKTEILIEIAAVEKELRDRNSHWRMHALQKAQRENRRMCEQIESKLGVVEVRIQEINDSIF